MPGWVDGYGPALAAALPFMRPVELRALLKLKQQAEQSEDTTPSPDEEKAASDS